MDLALVGYGRMGREIERKATARGHRVLARIHPGAADPGLRAITREALGASEVALEFTRPDQALANLRALAAAGVRAVVVGTTGWKADLGPARTLAAAASMGVVHADNFSLGMALFRRALAAAAGDLLRHGYEPYVLEWHHRGKRDAPSGTARMLAAVLEESSPGLNRHEGSLGEGLPKGRFTVAAVRAGQVPGTHQVGFESAEDTIEMRHAAHGREGFALGAVLAAEWVRGREGFFGFEDVLNG